MRAILRALTALAERSDVFTVAEANNLYNKLWLLLWGIGLGCFAAFLMNAGLGWTKPSLVLSIVFIVATAYIWTKPLNIVIVGGVGLASKIATHTSLASEIESALEAYLTVLKWLLLVVATFLFITGTVSFQGHTGLLLEILGGLSIYGLFSWKWPEIFIGTIGRRTVYGYAILVIVVSFVRLIPGPVWMKYTHWDPANLEPSQTERSLYRLERTQKEIRDESQAARLDIITAKIRGHEPLTDAEKNFVAQVEARQRRTPPARQVAPQAQAQVIPPSYVSLDRWPKFILPSKRKSGLFPIPKGKKLMIHVFGDDGKDVLIHNVFHGGCESPPYPVEGGVPGPGGWIVWTYLENRASVAVTVAVAYAPING